jgi:quercetin dioxygenase-like cupin family protein
MFTKVVEDVELAVANEDGAVNAGLRWVLGPKDGMQNFSLRVVELGQDGKSMHHKHDYEHEVFVLEGNGWLVGENDKLELKPGIAAFVPPNEIHQFQNAGNETFKFICVIPAL